ncbi:MAG: hypothetical protein LUD55_03570 [Oscillospiraceae bacterium]|nr:hypothetical protein [Oscillospiraceae bacterium]
MSKFSAKRFTAAAVSVAVIFSLSATAFAANEEKAEVQNTEGAYVAAGRTFSDEIVWGSESALEICLTDGSVFTGSFRREADAEGGFANLYIDSGSKWVVTADSALTSLYGDGVIVDTEGRTVTIAGINGEVYSAGEGERTVTVERCSLTESAGEGAAYSEATRGEVLLMLWRLENEPEPTAEVSFSDVDKNGEYYKAAAWAVENGLLSASGKTLGIEESLSLEELSFILYRYARSKGCDVSGYEDAPLPAAAESESLSAEGTAALKWLCGAGVLPAEEASAQSTPWRCLWQGWRKM